MKERSGMQQAELAEELGTDQGGAVGVPSNPVRAYLELSGDPLNVSIEVAWKDKAPTGGEASANPAGNTFDVVSLSHDPLYGFTPMQIVNVTPGVGDQQAPDSWEGSTTLRGFRIDVTLAQRSRAGVWRIIARVSPQNPVSPDKWDEIFDRLSLRVEGRQNYGAVA